MQNNISKLFKVRIPRPSTRFAMSSAQQRITEDEQRKYWEIFTALNPLNGYLSGLQAKTVLENSQLDNAQLEAIWDLADVDNGLVARNNIDFS